MLYIIIGPYDSSRVSRARSIQKAKIKKWKLFFIAAVAYLLIVIYWFDFVVVTYF